MSSLKIDFKCCSYLYAEKLTFPYLKDIEKPVELFNESRVVGLLLYLMGHSLPVTELEKFSPEDVLLARKLFKEGLVSKVFVKIPPRRDVFSAFGEISVSPDLYKLHGSQPLSAGKNLHSPKGREFIFYLEKRFGEIASASELNFVAKKGEITAGEAFLRDFKFQKKVKESKNENFHEIFKSCSEDKRSAGWCGEINAEVFNNIFTPGTKENENVSGKSTYYGKSHFFSTNWLQSTSDKKYRTYGRKIPGHKINFDFALYLNNLENKEIQKFLNGPMMGFFYKGAALLSVVDRDSEEVPDVDERELLKITKL